MRLYSLSPVSPKFTTNSSVLLPGHAFNSGLRRSANVDIIHPAIHSFEEQRRVKKQVSRDEGKLTGGAFIVGTLYGKEARR